jgi:hypothetical protein
MNKKLSEREFLMECISKLLRVIYVLTKWSFRVRKGRGKINLYLKGVVMIHCLL